MNAAEPRRDGVPGGHGQIKYDADSNRWITQAGRTYTADLSSLSDEQIQQLDAAGRKAVSGEAKLDEQRAMVTAAEAQQKAAAEAAAAQAAAGEGERGAADDRGRRGREREVGHPAREGRDRREQEGHGRLLESTRTPTRGTARSAPR